MKARIVALGLSATLLPLELFGGETDGLLSQPDLGMAKGAGIIDPPRASRGWRVGLGFAPLLGVDAEFSGLGVFTNPANPQPLGGGQNYNYDNGFVRLDATGNAGGNTWNWGYNGAAQYNAAAGGSMAFSISNGLANGAISDSDDFAPGIEAFAYYDLGELPALNLGGGPARWGLKATLHYANISIENSGALTAGVSRVTDTFNLNGVVPPLAPYAGSFVGPGPVLSDSPIRAATVIPGGASVTGSRDLDVNLFGLTVGPFLEMPISSRFSLSFEAGFSLALADGDYKFTSATTIPGAGTRTSSGSGDETSLLPGVSAGLTGFYQLNDAWSGYGGVSYQYYAPLEIQAGTSEAELDFGGAFILSLGAAYSF